MATFLHRARATRDQWIQDGIVRVAPSAVEAMLDIGCSDGRIAAGVAEQLKVSRVREWTSSCKTTP